MAPRICSCHTAGHPLDQKFSNTRPSRTRLREEASSSAAIPQDNEAQNGVQGENVTSGVVPASNINAPLTTLHRIKKRLSRDRALSRAISLDTFILAPLGKAQKATSRSTLGAQPDILSSRTPSHGGYDADARLIEDAELESAAASHHLQVSSDNRMEPTHTIDAATQTTMIDTYSDIPRLPSLESLTFSLNLSQITRAPSTEQEDAKVTRALDRSCNSEQVSPSKPKGHFRARSIASILKGIYRKADNGSEASSQGLAEGEREGIRKTARLQHPRQMLARPDSPPLRQLVPRKPVVSITSRDQGREWLSSDSRLHERGVAHRPMSQESVTALYSPCEHTEDIESTSSLHLQDMRISQHLRAMSNFSSDSLPGNISLNSGKFSSRGSYQDAWRQQFSQENQAITHRTSYIDDVFGNWNVDGQQESSLQKAEPHEVRCASRSSLSVCKNINETTAVWSKALTAVSDDVSSQRSRSLAGDLPQRHSSSRSSGKGSQRRVRSPVAEGKVSRSHSRASIEFKKVSTPHSFDRLRVGDRASHASSRTPAQDQEDLNWFPSEDKSPHLFREMVFARKSSCEHDEEDNCAQSKHGPKPEILVTPPSCFKDGEGRKPVRWKRLRSSSLGAWSRFPSYNRKQRNRSAGPADNVVVKDFAHVGNKYDFEEEDPLEDKYNPAKQKNKARLVSWRKRLLVDIPKMFTPRGVGFHKGESGHRTSVASGGKLEFPKLELVSGGGLDYNPTTYERIPKAGPQASPRIPVSSAVQRKSSDVDDTDSVGEELLNATDTDRITRASSVVDFVQERRDDSPFNGTFDGPHVEHAASARSNDRLHPNGCKTVSAAFIGRSNGKDSMELARRRRRTSGATTPPQMRQSTQDLLTMLDKMEAETKMKALSVAEEAWST